MAKEPKSAFERWHVPLVVLLLIAAIYFVYLYSLVPASTVPQPYAP